MHSSNDELCTDESLTPSTGGPHTISWRTLRLKIVSASIFEDTHLREWGRRRRRPRRRGGWAGCGGGGGRPAGLHRPAHPTQVHRPRRHRPLEAASTLEQEHSLKLIISISTETLSEFDRPNLHFEPATLQCIRTSRLVSSFSATLSI